MEFIQYKKKYDYMAYQALNGKLNPMIKFPAAFGLAFFDKIGKGTNGEALFRLPIAN